jgi:hypothetical protein
MAHKKRRHAACVTKRWRKARFGSGHMREVAIVFDQAVNDERMVLVFRRGHDATRGPVPESFRKRRDIDAEIRCSTGGYTVTCSSTVLRCVGISGRLSWLVYLDDVVVAHICGLYRCAAAERSVGTQ